MSYAPFGLFVGLVTLDVVYRVEQVPQSNQKVVALESAIAAGGPATNAAVAFRYLGNRANVLGVLGQHPMIQLIQTDLKQQNVEILDLEPERIESPPASSILITQETGDRAIISINAVRSQAQPSQIPPQTLTALANGEVAVVLVDGHQMAVAEAIAQQAQVSGVPVVVDCGSWKPGFERVLPWVDYAICSANFCPPAPLLDRSSEGINPVIHYLRSLGVPHIAITHGEHPVEFDSNGATGVVATPAIQPVDTLGAGDFFHGAFCHFILRHEFQEAIAKSSQVAARSCQFFGTRQWMMENDSP